MHYFQTRFLEEADKFIASLDAKTAKKVFYNVDLAEQTNDPKLLRNYKMKSGNFVQIIVDFKSGYFHFGTNLTAKKL